LQDKKKTFSHPERHFGSKLKFLVLGMKLPNPRSFAIIGEENKMRLALEDNTNVNVFVYRCNGRRREHPGANDGSRLELHMPETNFWKRPLLLL
jgi:hypothetical protein